MDMPEKIERDEIVVKLPNQIRQKNQDRQRRAQPEPFRSQVAAERREQNSDNNSCSANEHAIFGEHPETNAGTDRSPPSRIVCFAESHKKVSASDPGQIVERDVLHERS